MEEAKQFIDEDELFELKYETLCQDPVDSFKRVMAFCKLEWPQQFKQTIVRYPIENRNDKWHRELTPYQQQSIKRVTQSYLEKYSYV
jgi:hypothetical protein